MALLELAFHVPTETGPKFNCATCKPRIQQLRKCWEDRWDLDENDNPSVFPIRLSPDGQPFGFCPAKAQRDTEATKYFDLLMITAHTGAMLVRGGIEDQPSWFVEMASWFLQRYDQIKFYTRARNILGDGKSKSASQPKVGGKIIGGNHRGSRS